jgi:hypothetical protein
MAGVNITKVHAEAIAAKLSAEVRKGGAHDLAIVWYRGVRIANFGIRHGSRRNAGHGHVPKQLFISPYKCRELAVCTLTVDQWLQILRDLKKLPEDDSEEQPPTTAPPHLA